MKAIIIGYLFIAAIGIALVALVPLPKLYAPPCNFCSGSGQGEDCPRHDKAAKRRCLEDQREDEFCKINPKDCG